MKRTNSQNPDRSDRIGIGSTLVRWFDSEAEELKEVGRGVDWMRILPFILLHLACFAVVLVGASLTAVMVALALYLIRMFAITGFYHRYFSHRAFKTTRAFQVVMAVVGATAVQRGALWWAAHHRHHHRFSDQENDRHSRLQHGFLWSHLGWFAARQNFSTDYKQLRDFERYPELRFLNRFDALVPVAFALALYALGAAFERWAPGLQTNGWQLVVWGFCISTVVLYHATFTVNSLAHDLGKKRYETGDESRNSLVLALLTLGEGWHNNHHHFPSAARQGFFWWEIDVTWYLLKCLAALGLIWDLKPVPRHVRASKLIGQNVTATGISS